MDGGTRSEPFTYRYYPFSLAPNVLHEHPIVWHPNVLLHGHLLFHVSVFPSLSGQGTLSFIRGRDQKEHLLIVRKHFEKTDLRDFIDDDTGGIHIRNDFAHLLHLLLFDTCLEQRLINTQQKKTNPKITLAPFSSTHTNTHTHT